MTVTRDVTSSSHLTPGSIEGATAPSRTVHRRPGQTTRVRLHAVDRALDLLERARLSAGELRILLAVRDGEMAVSALARAFDRRPVHVRHTGARLFARGLLNWRDDAETKEPVFAITASGLSKIRPLVGAVASSDAVHS